MTSNQKVDLKQYAENLTKTKDKNQFNETLIGINESIKIFNDDDSENEEKPLVFRDKKSSKGAGVEKLN